MKINFGKWRVKRLRQLFFLIIILIFSFSKVFAYEISIQIYNNSDSNVSFSPGAAAGDVVRCIDNYDPATFVIPEKENKIYELTDSDSESCYHRTKRIYFNSRETGEAFAFDQFFDSFGGGTVVNILDFSSNKNNDINIASAYCNVSSHGEEHDNAHYCLNKGQITNLISMGSGNIDVIIDGIRALPQSNNVAYVEVNDHKIKDTACYKRIDGRPYFSAAIVFAGNIIPNPDPDKSGNPDYQTIYLNENVLSTLEDNTLIPYMHSNKMKLLLSLAGLNDQMAGWACMNDDSKIKEFSSKLVKLTNQYNLDGIDIDDEYSNCRAYESDYSILKIAKYMKEDPAFSGKLLTKALRSDSRYFTVSFENKKLKDYLDYVWDMDYENSNYTQRYTYYVNELSGLTSGQFMLGDEPGTLGSEIGTFTKDHKLPGIMFFNVYPDHITNSTITSVAQKQYGVDYNPVIIDQACQSGLKQNLQ